jgi:UPF0148 protein
MRMADKTDASIKKMADLLRRGATMLAQACPQCGSPLFKVGNDTYCATCDRRIVIVHSGQEVEAPAPNAVISQLRETLLRKLKDVNELAEGENDVESLTKLARLMVLLLQALHRIENMGRVANA